MKIFGMTEEGDMTVLKLLDSQILTRIVLGLCFGLMAAVIAGLIRS